MIEKQCDLVVLGGGGSGLTAAVRAAQVSGKKVIVLEKAPRTGGGMIMASTMRTFRSKWQEERGLPDVTESFLRKAMDATYWRLNVELCRNTVLATGQFFDWFCELVGGNIGDEFRVDRYVMDDESGPLGPQKGGPGGVTGSGRLFMDKLREKCDDFGVEVLTSTRMKDVETENGKITAVLADGPDGELRIRCRACVLATGSWINNEKILAELFPQFLKVRKNMGISPHTNPNYTGDGFIVAEKLDAMMDKKNYTMRLMGPMTMSRTSGTVVHIGASPYTLGINTAGKRYICEPSEMRFGGFHSGLVLMEQPEGYCYIVFDANILEASVQRELELNPSFAPDAMGNKPMPRSSEEAMADLDAQLNDGSNKVFRGETLDELMAQINVDQDAMRATVERYNQYCAEGFDWDCFKEKQYLIPCEKGPFYAVRGELGTDGAFGGIEVNGKMQAYRADGSVIEGLYVAGDFASGRFVNMGGVKVQLINDMSWALASGYLAGCNAGLELSDADSEA